MRKNKVLVIGDIMLDQYCRGDVLRVSPEAPVPVVRVKSNTNILGGAANVASNLASLGAEVGIVGVVGGDEEGEEILHLLKSKDIDFTNLCIYETYKTIVKQRILGNSQQIVRLDYNDEQENISYQELYAAIEKAIDLYDLIVISDYNKGVCTPVLCHKIISLCHKLNKKIIVDPKGTNWKKYENANLLTPNLKEISRFLGIHIENTDINIEEVCKGICKKLNTDYILITRSECGMTLIDKNNYFRHFSAVTKEVFDVSGAGDTVVAVLACFINCDYSNIIKIVNLANIAAGIVVGKLGTSTVRYSELHQELHKRDTGVEDKILTCDELAIKIREWKQAGEEVVFTNGCFDIFHKGHAHVITTAATYGDHLVVAINSDRSIRHNKGDNRPINSENDRAYLIASLSCVDAVVIFEEDTPERLLSQFRPNTLVKGGDYKIEEVAGREYVDRVVLVDYISGFSTSELIEKIKKNNNTEE